MFYLLKWYGDFVAEDGRAAICYWAELRWRGLHLRYASRLDAAPGGKEQIRTTLRAAGPPAAGQDGFRWREPALGLDAVWRPEAPAYEAALLETERGAVRWSCVAPSAVVETAGLRLAGYLEHLELTVPPWSLPIDTLLWGRFLSGGDSLVWIDWRGAHPLRRVLRRGVPVEAAQVESHEVALASGQRLSCAPVTTLREGLLGPNVLRSIPGLASLVPGRLLRLHEQKWLSRGELTSAGEPPARGWAIHEVVSWP